MDDADWSWWKDEDTAKIYDYLRDQLLAINALPYRKRARYIAHEIRCRNHKCQDVVIQLLELSLPTNQPVRVMRYRRSELDPLPVDMDPAERAQVMSQKRSYRLGAWSFYIITDRESELPGTKLVFSVCDCGRHEFTEQSILAREGTKSTNTPSSGPLMPNP
jgi:hypothetical protein